MPQSSSGSPSDKKHLVKVAHLDLETKEILEKIANTIRGLSMDAVQKADSGHPGLPMGCAEIGAYLYGYALRQNPRNSHFADRDRFILSAGHGSMLLYSCLYLAGYKLSLEEIKNFRQLHSQTPGHPELHETDGVETTTGPLGQGIGNAVGQALGFKLLGAQFNTDSQAIFDNKIVVLMGDGDVMEGVSSEVSCLAGHLKLDNLIVFYDSNKICLDGPVYETLSENTKERYLAYGWDVYEIDGHNLDEIHETYQKIMETQERPCLIIAHTIIGRGAPNKAGTHKAHGSPLGPEEVQAAKELLGIPETPFYVPQSVLDYFKQKRVLDQGREDNWKKNFEAWGRKNPELLEKYEQMSRRAIPEDLEHKLKELPIKSPVAGRKASQDVIAFLADLLPYLYGGSADLSGSDLTMMKKFPLIAPGLFKGRNIKFGVREFGMGTMASGLAETNMIVPFVGTFLTFSDYMRNAIRLCSLMKE